MTNKTVLENIIVDSAKEFLPLARKRVEKAIIDNDNCVVDKKTKTVTMVFYSGNLLCELSYDIATAKFNIIRYRLQETLRLQTIKIDL
jgi:hypothetical protein